jgi:hypothetical protein
LSCPFPCFPSTITAVDRLFFSSLAAGLTVSVRPQWSPDSAWWLSATSLSVCLSGIPCLAIAECDLNHAGLFVICNAITSSVSVWNSSFAQLDGRGSECSICADPTLVNCYFATSASRQLSVFCRCIRPGFCICHVGVPCSMRLLNLNDYLVSASR